jgi:uncharacterized protein YecT (DUF1311 family)
MHPSPSIRPHAWRRKTVTAIAALTLAVSPAWATDPAAAASSALPYAADTPAATDRCLDVADEAALLACRKSAHAEASRRLHQAVEKLRQRFGDDEPEHLSLFNTAQQAWRSYSRAECRFRHRESVGGAAYPAYLLSCLTDLSQQRLQALQSVIARP